jgi:hypothetical protein
MAICKTEDETMNIPVLTPEFSRRLNELALLVFKAAWCCDPTQEHNSRDEGHQFLATIGEINLALKWAASVSEQIPQVVRDELRPLAQIDRDCSLACTSLPDAGAFWASHYQDLYQINARIRTVVKLCDEQKCNPYPGLLPPAYLGANGVTDFLVAALSPIFDENGHLIQVTNNPSPPTDEIGFASIHYNKCRKTCKVFISYSHDSAEHCEHVRQLANALRSHGIDAELDQYHVRPPEGWPHWCEKQLRPENCDFVLMICTETYCYRVQNRVCVDKGQGVFWESSIIYNYIYSEKANRRFIPVLLYGAATDSIPIPIRNHTHYQIGRFDLDDNGYQELYRDLTKQPAVTKPTLGNIVPLDQRPAKTTFPTPNLPQQVNKPGQSNKNITRNCLSVTYEDILQAAENGTLRQFLTDLYPMSYNDYGWQELIHKCQELVEKGYLDAKIEKHLDDTPVFIEGGRITFNGLEYLEGVTQRRVIQGKLTEKNDLKNEMQPQGVIMDSIGSRAHVSLKEIEDEFRALHSSSIEGKKLVRLGIKLLGDAEESGAFLGSQYSQVRLSLKRWKQDGTEPWDEVIGHKQESDASVITYQQIIQALFPDLSDKNEDGTGKVALHLWSQWKEACLRIADLLAAKAEKRMRKKTPHGANSVVPASDMSPSMNKRFCVALSFPGEYRTFVEAVATCLTAHLQRDQIFYDKWYEHELIRLNLDTYLQQIYRDNSELIVVFLCAEYEQKDWCGLEWRAIRDLIKKKRSSQIMLFRFDNTEIPGLFSIDGYAEVGNRSESEIASLILKRLIFNDQNNRLQVD